MVEPDVKLFLKSWSEELLSRANRVRLLIGDAHWLSDGHHKEYLLRDFFARHLPLDLLICRGFVRPPDDDLSCSPENDILLCDPGRHAPFFNEGGLVIAPPASVVAFVEAKTTLSKVKVEEAVTTQVATMRTLNTYLPQSPNIWRGIVFASVRSKATLESSANTIRRAISAVFTLDESTDSTYLPRCIATYDRYLFLLTSLTPNTYQLRGFDLGGLSIACFMSELIGGVGALYQRHQPDRHLADIIRRISAEQVTYESRLRDEVLGNNGNDDD